MISLVGLRIRAEPRGRALEGAAFSMGVMGRDEHKKVGINAVEEEMAGIGQCHGERERKGKGGRNVTNLEREIIW